MSTITKTHLVRLCDLFAEHRSISHWRVSALVQGDGQYFRRLKAGGESVQSTMDKVVLKFSKLWPLDLTWPEDIPRPAADSVASPKPKKRKQVSEAHG